jgi:membrane-bound lytic murein transglycosylase A
MSELRGSPAIKPSIDFGAQLPPGVPALRKIVDPGRIPDFAPGFDHRDGLVDAIDHSLRYLSRPSSRRFFPYLDISHSRAVASLRRFRDMLANTISGDELHQSIVQGFDVYESVGADGNGTVLFTAYYEPILEARRRPSGAFQFPLYRRPADLISNPITGEVVGRRLEDGVVVPYPSRAEIEESRALEGTELVYLNDPFDAYLVHVQGSALLRLGQDETIRIGFNGSNGSDYTSIKHIMIEDGKIPPYSRLREVRGYFDAHPNEVAYYTRLNERFIFFSERTEGPVGSLNVPVTPYRSVATDKTVFPRACLTFVHTKLPTLQGGQVGQYASFESFALDQDTGGGIRAAGRCDLFVGTGSEAGELAGFVEQRGRLYYLFLKESQPPPEQE